MKTLESPLDPQEATNVRAAPRRVSAMTGDPAPGTAPTLARASSPLTSRGCAVIRPSKRKRFRLRPGRRCAVRRRRAGRGEKPRARDALPAVVPLLPGHGQGRACGRRCSSGREGDRPPGDRRHVHAEIGRRQRTISRASWRRSRRWDFTTFRSSSSSACSSASGAAACCVSARITITRNIFRRRRPLDLPGCFAMTEIGHGSNVRDIETTATYDPATGEFDLHSPTFTSGKNYIGNAGRPRAASPPSSRSCKRAANTTASMRSSCPSATRRAARCPAYPHGRQRPEARPQRRGQRPGLVRPRPRPARGDAGQVRAGRGGRQLHVEHQAARRHVFSRRWERSSPDASASATARLSIAKSGLAIAVRYGARRRQFGPTEGQPETILLDYPAHQRRLMPLLANAYALDVAFKHLTRDALTTESRRISAGSRRRRPG